MLKEETFHGKVRVASRIIDLLSSGLYHSPAACLKELINKDTPAAAPVARVGNPSAPTGSA